MQCHDSDRLLSEPIYFEIAIVSAAIVQSLPRSENFIYTASHSCHEHASAARTLGVSQLAIEPMLSYNGGQQQGHVAASAMPRARLRR